MILKKFTLYIFIIYLSSLIISCGGSSNSELTNIYTEVLSPPEPPIIQSITAGSNQITLSWENPSDINFEKTIILRSTNINLNYSQWEKIYEGKERFFSDTNLLSNTTYYYAFYSVNSTGSESSINISFGITYSIHVDSPKNVSSQAGNSQITLSWENPINFHKIVIKQNEQIIYEGTDNQFIDIGLISGKIYSYTIYAVDALGNSSNYISVSNIPYEDYPVYVYAFSDINQITISWENPPDPYLQKIVVIQYTSYTSPISNPYDGGKIIYEGLGSIFFVNSELEEYQIYDFGIYSVDIFGNKSIVRYTNGFISPYNRSLNPHKYGYLFGGDNHEEYLGCIGCPKSNSESICNEYGIYGNIYSSKSIFNSYSDFGNQYSEKSPWNAYSSSNSVPILYDNTSHVFYGYFTINTTRFNAVNYVYTLSQIYNKHLGDLSKVQEEFCSLIP